MGLGGTAIGGIKALTVDRDREGRDRRQRAAEIRYSPWTHMEPKTQIHESDALGQGLQYGFTGASLAQGLSKLGAGGAPPMDYTNADGMGGGIVPSTTGANITTAGKELNPLQQAAKSLAAKNPNSSVYEDQTLPDWFPFKDGRRTASVGGSPWGQ